VGLEDLPPGGMGVFTVHANIFLALLGHFGAKKGLLSRFRQVVAPLRRVVRRLRRALAALRCVVLALRCALAALRRVVLALRRALAALRRVVRALRRALAALRRVVQPLRRVVAALRPALFHGFDAFLRVQTGSEPSVRTLRPFSVGK
jgi:ABC-type transporter Mla subunit MlaD